MQGVVLTRSEGAAQLTLDRGEKRNALSLAMWRALPELIASCTADANVGLVIVRGAGGVFSGGADLDEFEHAYTHDPLAAHGAIQAGMQALAACCKPTLAVIEGPAIGAGLGLAVACDLRLAAADARFAVPPARLGLLYSFGDLARLCSLIGPARAKLLLYSARSIDAPTASAWGLVDEVAAPHALEAAVEQLRQDILAAAPFTVQACKRFFTRIEAGQREESDETRALFAQAFQGPEFREGVAAFRARRRPNFRSPQEADA
jgi:enoyl-CoA hydratase/carnithine racemase